MTFEVTSKKVNVKKDDVLYGVIELKTDEKSFTSYGSKKFLDCEIGEIDTYLTNHNLED
jgi:hypothetical protein